MHTSKGRVRFHNVRRWNVEGRKSGRDFRYASHSFQIWKITGECITTLLVSGTSAAVQVTKLLLHPTECIQANSDLIVSAGGGLNRELKVWDMETAKCTQFYSVAHSEGIACFRLEANSMHDDDDMKPLQPITSHFNTNIIVSSGFREVTCTNSCGELFFT